MKCMYCKEEIKKGAEICKHCLRRQPLIRLNIKQRLIIAIMMIFLVLYFAYYLIYVWN